MRILLSLIFIWSGAAYGDADIDHIKNKILQPFYYGDLTQIGAIKRVEDYATNSHSNADKYINSAYESMRTSFTGGLAESTEALKHAYGRANSCLAQMNLIYTLFQTHIEVESRLTSRLAIEKYRRDNINAETFNLLSDSILQVQNLHHDCYEFLLKVRDASHDFDTHSKSTGAKLCSIFEEVKYEGLNITKDIIIRPRHNIDNSFKWPDIEINYASDMGCPSQAQQKPTTNSDPSKPVADCRSGYFLSSEGTRYQSKYMHARENIRVASMTATFLLTNCPSCMAYIQQNITFLPASAAAVALPATVAFVVEMGVSYYEQEQRRKEIKELDKFIEEAEGKITAAFSRVIKADEFNDKRRRFCNEKESEFQQLKEDSILKVNAKEHIRKINDFFSKADTSIAWYNDLFLYATSGQAETRLIDDMAKARIAEKREKLYSILDRSKGALFLATSKTDLQKHQSRLASACLTGATKSEKLRNFRTAVRKFSASCDLQASLVKISTDYLSYEGGRKSDIRCHYSGFEPASALQVQLNDDTSLNLKVYQGDKVVSVNERVSSEAVSEKELYCISDTQMEFGIPSEPKIKAGTSSLDYSVDVNGIKIEEFQNHMTAIKKLNDSARSAASACARMLGIPAAPQSTNSCINGI